MRRLSLQLHEAGMSDHPERLTSRDRNGKPAPLGGSALGAPSRESDGASHREGGCGLPTTWIGAGNRCARDHWAHVGPASRGATCRRPRRGPNHGHHGAPELAMAQEPRGVTGRDGMDMRPRRTGDCDRPPGIAQCRRTPTRVVAVEARLPMWPRCGRGESRSCRCQGVSRRRRAQSAATVSCRSNCTTFP